MGPPLTVERQLNRYIIHKIEPPSHGPIVIMGLPFLATYPIKEF
mgnify:CR=1 FL=1